MKCFYCCDLLVSTIADTKTDNPVMYWCNRCRISFKIKDSNIIQWWYSSFLNDNRILLKSHIENISHTIMYDHRMRAIVNLNFYIEMPKTIQLLDELVINLNKLSIYE